MRTSLPAKGEIVARGKRVYEEKLRAELEAAHRGEYAVINVETGEYEVDRDHLTAADRAAARWPGGWFYAVKVGQATLGRIGGRFRRRAEKE